MNCEKINKQKLNSKGITLIALIITIIVMLILVGVTVSIAINGGLFANTRQAKTDTQNAINAENELSEGKVNIDGTIYNSLEDYALGITRSKNTGKIGAAINPGDYGKQVTNFKSKKYPDLVWRVFFEDSNNVYLISETADKDYPVELFTYYDYDSEKDVFTKKDIVNKYNNGADVSKQGQDLMPLAKDAGIFDITNESKGIIAIAYLCDISEDGPWDGYRDAEGRAVWSMGSISIELFAASYNAVQSNKKIVLRIKEDNSGYIANTNTDWFTTDMNSGIYRLKSKGFWWTSSPCVNPRGVASIDDSIGMFNLHFVDFKGSIRPIVCIPQSNFSGFTLK